MGKFSVIFITLKDVVGDTYELANDQLAKGLFNGDSEAVEENINKLTGKYVSIRDFTTKAVKENYYHEFLNGVLADNSSLIEQQESNFESGNGYIDILLKSRINKALL